MDAALELARARARAALELRARMGGGRGRKPKKQKGLARPAKVGPGAGCGTGKGGFQSGNVCAIEDGIPDKPKTFAKGGALKKSNPKADREKAAKLKAKAAAKTAAKQSADKKKSIEAKRKKAAIRKKQKAEKEAGDKKASEAAAAKKRQEMLQKIRVKKANKQIEVVGTPKSVADQIKEAKTSLASKKLVVVKTPKSIKEELEEIKTSQKSTVELPPKNPGESTVDVVIRHNKTAFNRLHKNIDDIELRYADRIDALKKNLPELEENRSWYRDQIRKKTAERAKDPKSVSEKEIADLAKDEARTGETIAETRKFVAKLESQKDADIRGAVTEFVSKEGGGLSAANPRDQIVLAVKRSSKESSFRESATEAYMFLNNSIGAVHQQALSGVRLRLDKGSGAHYDDIIKSAVHKTGGQHSDYHTSPAVIVHEVTHGLHYGDGSPGAKRAIAAIKDDYDTQNAKFLSENPGAKKVRMSAARSGYFGYKKRGVFKSVLGYCDPYCDFENGNSTGATEVLTMGVQKIFEKPSWMRANHRRHFDLTMAWMAGMLHR